MMLSGTQHNYDIHVCVDIFDVLVLIALAHHLLGDISLKFKYAQFL